MTEDADETHQTTRAGTTRPSPRASSAPIYSTYPTSPALASAPASISMPSFIRAQASRLR
eukprot:CAMPEP_0173364192 /NCGR_PEP_ID=MMETSP1144-20121109/22832_1 /TAXON_ID=483371 /ORGANISM="non described non described, Strain CCMP2298" /LENGTH=59 /DNA_ID=CAMNT_0014314281 /DNA_START=19 /DNA_END=195 /DNA_ORIENTATION=+